MSAGRAELTNVHPTEGGAVAKCDECGRFLSFWIDAGAYGPTVYEEASIVLRCSCGASSVYTVTP